MNTTLNATFWENPIHLVLKIKLDCTGKFTFEHAICATPEGVKYWLLKFCNKWDFDIFDAFDEDCSEWMRFYTLANGRFAKLPNDEVYAIIHNKLA